MLKLDCQYLCCKPERFLCEHTDYWQVAAILRSREKLREGEKYNVAPMCLPTSKAQMFATARNKSIHKETIVSHGIKEGDCVVDRPWVASCSLSAESLRRPLTLLPGQVAAAAAAAGAGSKLVRRGNEQPPQILFSAADLCCPPWSVAIVGKYINLLKRAQKTTLN